MKGATESQLSEILTLLESLDQRVARIEENQAEQLLSDYESHRDRLPSVDSSGGPAMVCVFFGQTRAPLVVTTACLNSHTAWV